MPKPFNVDETLDVKGLKCPIPQLKAKVAMKKMAPGQILEVISDDKGSIKNMTAYADLSGNTILKTEEKDDVFIFYLQKVEKIEEREEKASIEAPRKKKVFLICSRGTLDMAYPPLLFATTAASMDWMDVEVSLFFTSYGLDIINRNKYINLEVTSLGNPAIDMQIPNVAEDLPGMTVMATLMMKKMIKDGNLKTIPDLIKQAKELGVEILGCEMTMDIMGVKKEDLIDEVDDTIDFAVFVGDSMDADFSMFF